MNAPRATTPVAIEVAADAHRRRAQRLGWDAVARRMPDLFPAASTQYYRQCEIALIRRNVESLRGKRVLKLDLWNEAFNTRILQWMQAEGAETFGLDVSAVTTAQAFHNARGTGHSPMHLLQSDIRHLPFPAASFDFVYTMGTIEHIDEYASAVSEVQRVLKPGGKAIIGVPHKWNIFLRPLLVGLLTRFGKYPYAPEKVFSAAELRRVIEQGGLHVIRRTGILTIPGLVRMADVFLYRRGLHLRRLMPLILRPFELLETRFRWPATFGYLIAMVVEKRAGDDPPAAP